MERGTTSNSNSNTANELATVIERVRGMEAQLTALAVRIDTMVTLDRYRPVEKLAYGMTGMALGGLLLAILALVVHRGP